MTAKPLLISALLVGAALPLLRRRRAPGHPVKPL